MKKEGKEKYPVKKFFSLEQDQIELGKKELDYEALKEELDEKRRRHRIQEILIFFFTALFSVLVLFTLVIILLHGFHVQGFELDVELIKFLGTATVGEVAGLLIICLNALFGFGDAKKAGKS